MSPSPEKDLSRRIKDFAFSIGFDLIGIAPSRQLNDHKEVLKKWLTTGMNADMDFMFRDLEKRSNPALLVDGARSVIVGGINYYSPEKQGGNGIPVVSKYAYGKDYHIVLCEKLEILLEFITSCLPEASGKVFVDSAPIFEKAWAREAGLGWIGKNSILINKGKGSFIFLGEIVLDIELQYDKPFVENLCGSCRLCMDTCPTNAINENKTINASKCISWLTVENKKPLPEELKTRMENRIFGCDICQDVCPWNINSKPNNNPDLKLSDRLKKMTEEDWLSLSREEFDIIFDKTSVKRTTYKRLTRNINFVLTGESKI